MLTLGGLAVLVSSRQLQVAHILASHSVEVDSIRATFGGIYAWQTEAMMLTTACKRGDINRNPGVRDSGCGFSITVAKIGKRDSALFPRPLASVETDKVDKVNSILAALRDTSSGAYTGSLSRMLLSFDSAKETLAAQWRGTYSEPDHGVGLVRVAKDGTSSKAGIFDFIHAPHLVAIAGHVENTYEVPGGHTCVVLGHARLESMYGKKE